MTLLTSGAAADPNRSPVFLSDLSEEQRDAEFDRLQGLLPEDPENSILKKLAPSGNEAEDVPAEGGADQAPADSSTTTAPPADEAPANN